jgi:predicted NBD/HSP70 family sugar kinase
MKEGARGHLVAEAVGIDIGGTKVLADAPFDEDTAPERAPTGAETAPAALEAFVRRFVERRPGAPGPLGIAVPGLMDEDGCVTASDVLPHLVGWRPAEVLADAGAPVRVLNDGTAALWGECEDAAPDATVAAVMAGTSVGAAFLVHGTLLRGASGAAGELGYLPVHMRAKRVDSLAEAAGGAALADRLGTDGAGVARRAAAGEAKVLRAIEAAGRMLGLGLAGVINVFNPSLIAVGGGTAGLPGYYEAALQSAEHHALPIPWAACTLRRARAAGVVRGAALYAAGRTADG